MARFDTFKVQEFVQYIPRYSINLIIEYFSTSSQYPYCSQILINIHTTIYLSMKDINYSPNPDGLVYDVTNWQNK